MDSDLLDYHHWMNKFLKVIVPTMQQQWIILLLLCPSTCHPPCLRICGPSSCYPLIHLYLWSICFPLICFPSFPLIRDLPFIIGDSPSRLRLRSICFPLFRGQLFISVSTGIIIRNNIIQ